MNTSPASYKRHRFPPQIIAHAVWLYFRFPLSLRLVEELPLERGIAVSFEQSAAGERSSARIMRVAFAARSPAETMCGIWTRSSSPLPAGLAMAGRRSGRVRALRDRPEPP
jgi:hypothetical protein